MKIRALISYMIIIIVFIQFSCKKDKDDDLLTIEKQTYIGKEFKINGYYHNDYTVSNIGYTHIYFFYKNGVFLEGGSSKIEDIIEREVSFSNGEFYNWVKNDKENWGLFLIQANQLIIENWVSSVQFTPLGISRKTCQIINDSTFKVLKTQLLENGKVIEEDNNNYVFNYKEFTIKPDSINSFVK